MKCMKTFSDQFSHDARTYSSNKNISYCKSMSILSQYDCNIIMNSIFIVTFYIFVFRRRKNLRATMRARNTLPITSVDTSIPYVNGAVTLHPTVQ